MSRALVSGGTGFVGRFIVEGLLSAGYTVTIGSRTPPPPDFFSRPVGYLPLGLDPALDQQAAFAGIDHFVHAAFEHIEGRYRGGEGDDPAGFVRANLQGTARLFQEACSSSVRRCVFLSSRAVYGTPLENAAALEETTPVHPDTLYGIIKLSAEEELRALARPGFVTTSLRITGVYGAAGNGKRHKWQDLFKDYLADRPVAPRVGTEVHGQDVAYAVRAVLESDPRTVDGEVFNVSDLIVDRRDLLGIVREVTGCPHALPDAAALVPGSEMATAKLRELGWQPGGWPLLERTVCEFLPQQ
ncbi:NAD(P)-dependent oxidoreductase [Rhizobiaceae bacterium n13]|uniref:NAD(P)-dependent oxidoreductase n=1 Tax=Ferirhizobium litorale TaxID=2927786 RepID=A0AAE3QBC8_9HYPH|nr:NAD(P)-dependent oxidoreductase [Fererhizobium litorale]MDI7860582.1 NAD(P)-dependent oxidoreductase [Fererhizobium litorale]MDI7920730.1 NAD(P)-dependent oxidoreductase [Fererhizobium litorale]